MHWDRSAPLLKCATDFSNLKQCPGYIHYMCIAQYGSTGYIGMALVVQH